MYCRHDKCQHLILAHPSLEIMEYNERSYVFVYKSSILSDKIERRTDRTKEVVMYGLDFEQWSLRAWGAPTSRSSLSDPCIVIMVQSP